LKFILILQLNNLLIFNAKAKKLQPLGNKILLMKEATIM